MATYTVTETIIHGGYSSSVVASAKNLPAALTSVLCQSPYGYGDFYDAILAKFEPYGLALVPSVEFGRATYRLTITPDPDED